ncbi:16S rRNA (uracil(1498)-N(3))-methyltransferase [Aliiroseovarius sp. PTFE2010]|uniref:16S rRNA (uracil(1498)-N(3))-methyltransferase n=1 Tax=Aliiroseovarius sp. PTFE2010 TaxID=3417190 RepID=UPI003CF3D979
MDASKVRLFVEHPLGPGQSVPLSRDQAHYLFNVMRLRSGNGVELFNGRDGAWLAEVAEAGKKTGVLVCREQRAPQQDPPDLWLLFAPIKKARTDFIVEKATELGTARICPVITEHTNSERVRVERLQAHAVEAAEQCGGTFVPPVDAPRKLRAMLDDWPADRQLLFCDEGQVGTEPRLSGDGKKWAILIGPEGGFSEAERSWLKNSPFVTQIGLGPRILRADTAAVAAIVLWQNALGDW